MRKWLKTFAGPRVKESPSRPQPRILSTMQPHQCPPRFLDLKREIISATERDRLTASWADLLQEMAKVTEEIAQQGPDCIPQVNFSDLENLTSEQVDNIRRKGSVVVRGVVDIDEAVKWKLDLQEFINNNPHVEGFPQHAKQFFHLYWTPSQVHARAHPNVLKVNTWLNNLYHFKSDKRAEDIDLSCPLVYADRFRIRHPGTKWNSFPPHIDGGSIERWEDVNFRRCFADILAGNWRQHDPYELAHRLDARSSLYGRPDQRVQDFPGLVSIKVEVPFTMDIFYNDTIRRSETAPTEGTLKVFPDVAISNAYIILRPFFRPMVPLDDPAILDPKNWELDISTPNFHGITRCGTGFIGPQPTPELHPHFRLNETMTSVPKVYPGDMVFWHCDVIHSVEQEHTGRNDSAVMYIPAVPKTPQNWAYILRQAEAFRKGANPPDFGQTKGVTYVGLAVESDIKGDVGRMAMGLPIHVA